MTVLHSWEVVVIVHYGSLNHVVLVRVNLVRGELTWKFLSDVLAVDGKPYEPTMLSADRELAVQRKAVKKCRDEVIHLHL